MHVALRAGRLSCSTKPKARPKFLQAISSSGLSYCQVQPAASSPSRESSIRTAAFSSGNSLSRPRTCRPSSTLRRQHRTAGCTTTAAFNPWIPAAMTAAVGLAAWLLGVRNKTASLQIGGSSFQQTVLEHCPTINAPYATYPLLNNGHFETIFAARLRRTPSVQYSRTILDMPDGGKVTLDREILSASQDLPQDAPVVILLPGLTGGSGDSYVQHMVVASRQNGVRAIVFNGRGTSDSPVTSPQFYSASYTGDMRGVVATVQKEFPSSMLMAVGWSLGANILVTYLGEEKSDTPLVAAASLCNPFDLAVADENFHVGFNRIYDVSLANGLRKIFQKHKHVFYNTGKPFNPELAANCQSIREFDDAVTRVSFDWPDVDAYYRGSGSARSIPDVAIPLLCIQADNDPIAPERCIPYQALRNNPMCTLVVTPGGGHLGWVSGPGVFFGPPWTNDAVAEWLAGAVNLLQMDQQQLNGINHAHQNGKIHA